MAAQGSFAHLKTMSSYVVYRSHLLHRRGSSMPSYFPRDISVLEHEISILYSLTARHGVAVQTTPPDPYRLGCITIFACSKCRPRPHLLFVLMWSSGRIATNVGPPDSAGTLLRFLSYCFGIRVGITFGWSQPRLKESGLTDILPTSILPGNSCQAALGCRSKQNLHPKIEAVRSIPRTSSNTADLA